MSMNKGSNKGHSKGTKPKGKAESKLGVSPKDSREPKGRKAVLNDTVLLESMLASTNDALVFTDREGIIIKISKAYASFLGKKVEECIGRHIADIIENTRMPVVMETGVAEIAQLQKIKGHTIIATRIPIKKNKKVIGSFGRVIFKDLRELSSMHDHILDLQENLNLYKTKFESLSSTHYSIDDIIGRSRLVTAAKENMMRFSNSNSNIIIFGESGTGKELFAHAIHSMSSRSESPFISVNCSSIPSELLESEFFGYVEGAFTGSKKGGKLGLFHAADKGTLFLDEIGDLPLHMQAKLLRAIQEKEVRRIGATVSEKVNVRIIAATNKDLLKMVNGGLFRDDLYYRLNVLMLVIPPLRDRMEDMPILVNELLLKIADKNSVIINGIDEEALKSLYGYSWPGNVRELENVLERATNFLGTDRVIHKEHILLNSNKENTGINLSGELKTVMNRMERHVIESVLIKNNGNRTKSAKELGISRTSLYEKMEKHELNNVKE